MAAIAPPPVEPVITPAAPAPAPPSAPAPRTAPPQMQGTAADRMEAKIKNFLTEHVVAPPPAPTSPDAPPAPPATQQAAPPAEPTVPPAIQPPGAAAGADQPPKTTAPAEVDLENIDFDAPPVEATPAAPAEPGTPTISTQAAWETLQAKIDSGNLDDIEAAFLRTPKGKSQLELWKTFRVLKQPSEEGGIGRIPTIDEIKHADKALQDLTAIRHEFTTNPQSFTSNLLSIDPATGRSYFGTPEEIVKVIESIPSVLMQSAQRNPELIGAYAAPVFKMFFDTQYQRALVMPNDTPQAQELKARALDALQMTEFLATSAARPLPGITAQQTMGDDPRVAALERQLQEMQQQQGQQNSARVSQFVSQVDSISRTNAMSDIETTLKATGLAAVYPKDLLEPLKQALYDQVDALVFGKNGVTHDKGGLQTFTIQRDEQSRSQNPDPARAADLHRRLFRNALQTSPEIKSRLTNLVQAAKATSDARNSVSVPAQDRVEPSGGGGTPAPQSVLPARLERLPNENTTDYNARRLAGSIRAHGAIKQ